MLFPVINFLKYVVTKVLFVVGSLVIVILQLLLILTVKKS